MECWSSIGTWSRTKRRRPNPRAVGPCSAIAFLLSERHLNGARGCFLMNNDAHLAAVQSETERSKAVVDEYFQAGVQGRLTSFAGYLHPDFTVTAPIKIVDHRTVRDDKAISLWAAYFEPQAVLEALGIKHCLGS